MPQNGAGETTVAPQAPTPQTPGAPAAAPPKPAEPDYRALHEAAAKKIAALEAEKGQFSGKLSEYEKAEKARKALEQERTRNPSKYLEALFGPDWYDTATKLKTGTVTPGAVSAQLTEAEQRMEQRFQERERALTERLDRLQQAEEDRARQDIYRQAGEHAKTNSEKYPLTNKYGKAADVGALIEGHFKATSKRNPDGTWEPGEMWTPEQGAAEMEKYWAGIRDMVLKAETGREPERPRESGVPVVRPDVSEPKDEVERRARVDAAWAAIKANRQQQRPN